MRSTGSTRKFVSGSSGASCLAMARTDGNRPPDRVDAEDVVAVPEEVDEIAPAAAAGIDDTHAGRDSSTQELIEEVDVDLAELGARHAPPA